MSYDFDLHADRVSLRFFNLTFCLCLWLAVFLSFCFVLCVSGKPENSASNEVPGELLSVEK